MKPAAERQVLCIDKRYGSHCNTIAIMLPHPSLRGTETDQQPRRRSRQALLVAFLVIAAVVLLSLIMQGVDADAPRATTPHNGAWWVDGPLPAAETARIKSTDTWRPGLLPFLRYEVTYDSGG